MLYAILCYDSEDVVGSWTKEEDDAVMAKLAVPEMPATVTPLVFAIPVQLIAYHVAAFMGKDVDQPRNLAKSVTVE